MRMRGARVSYADLEHLPDEGRRYELDDGEVRVVPAPLPRHQLVSLRLVAVFFDHVARFGGLILQAPVDIVFSDYDVLQPDLVFFSKARQHLVDPDRPIRSSPDIAIEILSPSTERVDRGAKMRTFARFAVPECWLVDPAGGAIEIYTPAGGRLELRQTAHRGDIVRSFAVPSLEFPAAQAFLD